MNNYTNYCTEEQTNKALKLGAPIKMILDDGRSSNCIYMYTPTTYIKGIHGTFEYIIPTTDQMIGWLEEQEDIDEILVYKNGLTTSFTYGLLIFTMKESMIIFI